MNNKKKLPPNIIAASKKAAAHEYDKSKYIITDGNVRRDVKTGRLTMNDDKKDDLQISFDNIKNTLQGVIEMLMEVGACDDHLICCQVSLKDIEKIEQDTIEKSLKINHQKELLSLYEDVVESARALAKSVTKIEGV